MIKQNIYFYYLSQSQQRRFVIRDLLQSRIFCQTVPSCCWSSYSRGAKIINKTLTTKRQIRAFRSSSTLICPTVSQLQWLCTTQRTPPFTLRTTVLRWAGLFVTQIAIIFFLKFSVLDFCSNCELSLGETVTDKVLTIGWNLDAVNSV